MNKKASSQTRKKRSIYQAVFFTGAVLVLLIAAIIIRLILLFSHSTYDGHTCYTLEITEKNNHALILAFSPDIQSISSLRVVGNSTHDIGKQLEIPISATVETNENFDTSPIPSTLWNIFIHFHAYRSKNLNQADVYKLFIFSQNVKATAITIQTIHIPLTDQTEIQSIPQLIIDHTLFEEGETIAVVNASGLSGRGAQLTKLLTNIGANVISVTTADSNQVPSMIYTDTPQTYTVKRLKTILGFPVRIQKPPISDILIIIGTDTNNSSVF